MKKILGICGSLRAGSSNSALLMAAQIYFHDEVWDIVDLSTLPYFDPDNQYGERIPIPVLEMRELATAADLIFISTPEYAHGIPGILKNGLEWMFSEGTQKKPVAVVIGSSQGEWAKDQLFEVLKTMDFTIDETQFHMVKGARSKVSTLGFFIDQEARAEFEVFCSALKKYL